MSYTEHTLTQIRSNNETWRIFRRDFEGLRVSHGAFEEWPVVVPKVGLRWNAYEFNGRKSMPCPNSPGAIPQVITQFVTQLLHA